MAIALLPAQTYLSNLQEFPFAELDVSAADCANPPIVIHSTFGTSSSDFRVYDWELDPFFRVQSLAIAKIRETVNTGTTLLSRLYATRGCYRSLPQVQSNEDPNRAEIYSRTFQILKPEVEKAKELMRFLDSAIVTLRDVFLSLRLHYKDHWASDMLLAETANLFNLLVTLDYVKNMKGSLNNDLSFFKRAMANMGSKASASDEETAELHKLYLFLGNHDQFVSELRKQISVLNGHEEFILDVCNWCAETHDSGALTIPQEKWGLLKAMALGLLLLDTSVDEKDAYLCKKKVKLDRFARILRNTPVVPLFGDVPICLAALYGEGAYLAKKGWESDSEEVFVKNHYLPNLLPLKKQQYSEYIAEWSNKTANLGVQLNQLSNVWNTEIYNLVHRGIALLSSLVAQVLESSAWKFVHPAKTGLQTSGGAADYNLAVKCNLTTTEMEALLEVIILLWDLPHIAESC
ncbi:Cytoplasmic FMR1-interacting protein 2 [Gonapodya sp. JEL0774]|nr:Cytoplasmic FMR1-interacting protein 2 [Gonapodya sp. JEL0774]